MKFSMPAAFSSSMQAGSPPGETRASPAAPSPYRSDFLPAHEIPYYPILLILHRKRPDNRHCIHHPALSQYWADIPGFCLSLYYLTTDHFTWQCAKILTYASFFSNSAATSHSRSRIFSCCGQICSHFPHLMQSDAFPCSFVWIS